MLLSVKGAASNGKMRFMNLVMPAALSAMVGGTCLMIGCTVNLTGQSILTEYTDYAFSMTDFTIANLPVLVLVIVYCLAIGYRLAGRIGDATGAGFLAVKNL